MTDCSVLIIGGGPVGLALAFDLGKRGVRSILVERDSTTGGELLAKAGVLNERTMEYFRSVGLVDKIANVGIPDDVSRDTVYCTSMQGHFIGREPTPSTNERGLHPQCAEILRKCPQFLFDPLLAKAVFEQGMADIFYSTVLESFEQDGDGVTATVRNLEDDSRQELRAMYMVGCDGAGSLVRRSLGIAFPGPELGYSSSAMIRVHDLTRFHRFGMGERWMFFDSNGTWANLTSVDLKDLYRFTIIFRKKDGAPSVPEVRALIDRAFGRNDIPYELLNVSLWRRSQCTAERFSKGRVFLAGDAAHTTSPTGGHGLNTGLGDVSDLGWILSALVEGWGGPRLIEAYDRERRPIAIRNGTSSTENYQSWTMPPESDEIMEDGPDGDAQRVRLCTRLTENLRQEWHSLGIGMGYSYSDSPIIVPDGTEAPPDYPSVYVQTARPGHRAPHHWLNEDQSTIDLFGDGLVLLRLGNNPPDDIDIVSAAEKAGMPLVSVRIADPAVHELYERALVIVRPDGMVAWRADRPPADAVALVDQIRGQ